MNLLSLKYFIAISEYSSFTKAAEHLYVTQPTLSRQISLLEDEFGVQLFERSKRSLMLTDAGRILLPEAKDIVNRCDRVAEMMKGTKKNVRGTLSIGYQGFLDNQLLNASFKSATKKYPYLDFLLFRCNFEELNHFLMDNRFDIIFTVAVTLGRLPNVAGVKIQENTLELVVPRNHPLARHTSVSFSEIAEEQFIMMEKDASPITVDYTLELCAKNGFTPNVAQYVRDAQTMLYLVGSGHGIAFMFSQVVVPNPEDVKILTLTDADVDFDIVLAYKKDNKNPAIPLFLSEVRQNRNLLKPTEL